VIFDSARHNKWNGRGLNQAGSSFVVLKGALLKHPIIISPGEYQFKVIGKKRSGNGEISFSIESEDGTQEFEKITVFSTSSWSEFSYTFKVRHEKAYNFVISRSPRAYGNVELGRMIIQKDNTSQKINIESPSKTPSNLVKRSDLGIVPTARYATKHKRIGVIIPYGIFGGGEIYLQNFINRLKTQPIEFCFLYIRPNDIMHNIKKNVVHRDVKTKEQLSGVLLSEQFDFVIYYNSLQVYQMLQEIKQASALNSRLVEIYHSDFLWGDAVARLRQRKNLDQMIVVADRLAADITGVDHRTHIPVGIDLEKFTPRNKELSRRKIRVKPEGRLFGSVARLSSEKNLEYLIELAKLMPNDTFIIAGDGPLYNELQTHKPRNLTLLGFVKDVETVYNALDAFILPSKMEGTPISILEAMASGTPVFVANVGAIGEIVQNDFNGHFLSMNLEEDARLIDEHWNDSHIKEAAINYVDTTHNVEVNAIDFFNVFLMGDNYFRPKIESSHNLQMPGEYI